MSNITKIKSGLLYLDDFKERSLLWTLSPGDRLEQLEFNDNGLTMHRSNDYLSYTMKEPERDYTCILELDHIPNKKNEIAGIILLSTPEDYAECQSLRYERKSELINGRVSNAMVQLAVYEIMESRYIPYSVNDEEDNIDDLVFSLAHSEVNVDSTEYKMLKSIVGNYIKNKHFALFGEEYEDTWMADFDDTYIDTEFYKYIKFNKIGHTYTFYASIDRKRWINVGTTSFTYLNEIGLFLYGRDKDEESDILKEVDPELEIHDDGEIHDPDWECDKVQALFKRWIITDSNYIRFENIPSHYHVELTDDNDDHVYFDSGMEKYRYAVDRTENVLQVNTNTIGLPIRHGKIRIYKDNDYEHSVASEDFIDMLPGDSFALDYDIRLFVGDVEVTNDEVFDLGEFHKILDFVEFRIHNFSDIDAENLTVSVAQYSEYYGGWREVMIAMYDESIPMDALEYHKSLFISELPATSGRRMYMRLKENTHQTAFKTSESYRFKITIT
jgi:hypothetical protein